MLGSLNRHYSNIEDNKPLDPRFKDKFFSSLVKSLDAKMQLEEEVKFIQAQDSTEDNQKSPSLSPPCCSKQDEMHMLSKIDIFYSILHIKSCI